MRWSQAEAAGQQLHDQWGEALYRFAFGSLRRFGLFNADPHPGNYLFGDDGTVTFLDFGCVKRFTANQQRAFYEIAEAVLHDDVDALKRLFLELGFLSDDAPSGEEIMAWYRPTFAPMVETQPFTFTPEFAAAIVQRIFDPFGPVAGINSTF